MSARWSFSLILLAIYLALFHVWIDLPRAGVVSTGLVATLCLSGLLLRARRRGYFLNAWDAFWHAAVILDVALEGLFVPQHLDHSFYWCAVAFILVVGGYRVWFFRQLAAPSVNR